MHRGKQATAIDAVRIVLLVLVAGAVPVALVAQIRGIELGAIALGLIAAYSGARFIFVLCGGQGRVLQLFFWLFAWVFFGIAPLMQVAERDWPWPGAIAPDVLSLAALVILASLFAYDIGIVISRRKDIAIIAPPRRVLSPARLKLAAPVAITLCAIQIALIGPESLINGRAARSEAVGSGDSISAAVSSALLVTSVFVVTYLFIRAKRSNVLTGWTLTTAFLLLLTLFVANPTSTARYRVASVGAGLLLGFLWPLTRKHLFWLGATVVLGLAVVFPALNGFRRQGGVFELGTNIAENLRSGDYDAFQQVANTLIYVDERGHTLGRQLMSSLLFFVPREIWSDKALDTGVVVASFREYVFTNLSAPIQAEAYIDGGIFLVVLLFVVLGLVTGWAERRANHPALVNSYIGLAVPVIAAYQVIMLRGSLLQSMAGFATTLAFVWLCTSRVKNSDTLHTQRRVEENVFL